MLKLLCRIFRMLPRHMRSTMLTLIPIVLEYIIMMSKYLETKYLDLIMVPMCWGPRTCCQPW